MSSPKPPVSPKALPLTDPNNVGELFANELTGIQVLPDGTCHLTFSIVRPGHRMPTGEIVHNDPDVARVISARIVMPIPALTQTAATLGKAVRNIGIHQVLMAPQKAN